MKGKQVLERAALLLFFAVAVAGLSARAAEKPTAAQLSLDIKVEKEVKMQMGGKTMFERTSAEKATKGDTLVYTITYTNKTSAPVKSVSVADPVPAGTIYIPETAAGKDTEITFSVDGGKTYGKAPVKYKAKKADGTVEEKLAPPDMYSHIKWLIERTVQPGASGQVSFKVKIK